MHQPPKSADSVWREIYARSGHFFSPATMQFFSSRVSFKSLTASPEGFAFITSEQSPFPGSKRLYTIRFWRASTGQVETLSDFQEFQTYSFAKRVLKIYGEMQDN